jgi:hypothetical protein
MMFVPRGLWTSRSGGKAKKIVSFVWKKSNSIPIFFPEIEKDDTTVHGGSDVGWQGDVHCRLCGQVEAADHMFFSL